MDDIRLRDAVASDLETLFGFEQDTEAARRVNFPSRSREDFMAHWNRRILGDPEVVSRTVLVDGAIAGNIGCWDAEGERMIGYWFGREFWGRGIGTAAVREFVAELPWRPLYADPAVGNVGSVRLLQKCGFRPVRSILAPNHYGDGDVEHVMLRLD